MKLKIASLLVLSAVLLAVSCRGPQGDRAATGEAKQAIEAKGQAYVAQVAGSSIEWIGTKPTGQHNGTINIKKGQVIVDGGQIIGGEIVIDMNSIAVLDITDPETNANLRNHLLSADFFETETYPEARFVFTSVENFKGEQTGQIEFTHLVSGNLTMKDTTRNVTFPVMIDIHGQALKAVSDNFVIDRSEWNVKYGSRKFFDNLMDNFIHDEIKLRIMFQASAE